MTLAISQPAPKMQYCQASKCIAKHADVAVLALPVVACTAAGVGFAKLEAKKNPVLHGIGWMGRRISVIAGVFAALPLLIYVVFKAALAKLLNFIARGKCEGLRKFAEFSARQQTIVTTAVFGMGALTTVIPEIIKKARNMPEAINEIGQKLNAMAAKKA